jgi:hypothetical protein
MSSSALPDLTGEAGPGNYWVPHMLTPRLRLFSGFLFIPMVRPSPLSCSMLWLNTSQAAVL